MCRCRLPAEESIWAAGRISLPSDCDLTGDVPLVKSHPAPFAHASHSSGESGIAPDEGGEHVASLGDLFDEHPTGVRGRPGLQGEVPDFAVAFVDEIGDAKAVR